MSKIVWTEVFKQTYVGEDEDIEITVYGIKCNLFPSNFVIGWRRYGPYCDIAKLNGLNPAQTDVKIDGTFDGYSFTLTTINPRTEEQETYRFGARWDNHIPQWGKVRTFGPKDAEHRDFLIGLGRILKPVYRKVELTGEICIIVTPVTL